MFASLDHLSGGRAGWNFVTGGNREGALNYSRDSHMEHADRYDRAEEFADVVLGLWDNFEQDAFPRDKASGRFLDPKKMHILNHKGKHFSVKGPLSSARSPQGRPVLIQAVLGTRQKAHRAHRRRDVHFAILVRAGPRFLRRRQGAHGRFRPLA